MTLAIQSKFFHKLFFGDFAESKQAEVELKDVKYDDFVQLLKVITQILDRARSFYPTSLPAVERLERVKPFPSRPC